MKNYLVLFDYDGTLFDTSTVDIVAINKARGHFDLPPLSPQEVLKLIGMHTIDIVKAALPTSDPLKINHFLELFTKYEVEEVFEHGTLFPGVLEMLSELNNRQIPLAICSNGGKEYFQAQRERFGLDQFFTRIWSETEGYTKSQAAAEMLRDAGVSQGIFVGDREMDIIAGHANGLVTICSTLGFGGDEPYSADYVVHSISQMQETICRVVEGFSAR